MRNVSVRRMYAHTYIHLNVHVGVYVCMSSLQTNSPDRTEQKDTPDSQHVEGIEPLSVLVDVCIWMCMFLHMHVYACSFLCVCTCMDMYACVQYERIMYIFLSVFMYECQQQAGVVSLSKGGA